MATRRLVLLGLGGVLGACGFRPLYRQTDGVSDVRQELAAVEIPLLTSRVGYLVRDSLLDQLNPAGAEVPTRYRLEIGLRRRTNRLGIQIDNTITRFNLVLTARFRLRDLSSQEIVYQSIVRRIASYNAIRAPYAELTAELDAERRAARDVGTDILTQLAVHFAREEEAV